MSPKRRKDTSALGLAYGEVELADHNTAWVETYGQLAANLKEVLGETAAAIEHVGSTAVPGIAAKPIIDIAVGLAPDADVPRVVEALAPLGYVFRGDKGDAGGLVFVLEDKPWHRLAHIHAVPFDSPHWHRYLGFRELLKSDATARAAYDQLKRRLAEQFPHDRQSYTAAKDSFVRELLDN